jgi:hypothetical protein
MGNGTLLHHRRQVFTNIVPDSPSGATRPGHPGRVFLDRTRVLRIRLSLGFQLPEKLISLTRHLFLGILLS